MGGLISAREKHDRLFISSKHWCYVIIALLSFAWLSSQPQSVVTVHAETEQTAQMVDAPSSQVTSSSSTTTAPNEVPQDTTTVNNQTNVNAGNLDNYSLSTATDVNAQLNASGWQATGQSNQDAYRYMIVYDNTDHQEIAREKVTPQERSDVQRAYPNVANSQYSGFNVRIKIPVTAVNHSLSLVARYSNDAVNGEGQHVDYWFGPLIFDQTNRANLDQLSSDGQTLTVAGWHATNQAVQRPYHYVIAYDQTRGREITRQAVTAVDRPDVARAFPTIFNAGTA